VSEFERVRLLPGSILLSAWAFTPAAAAAPPTFDVGCHEALAERVHEGTAREYRRVLGDFDRHLKARPEDHVAALERCRFIDLVSDEAEIEGAADDARSCREDLEEKLGSLPEVALYLLEATWGEAALARGEPMLERARGWTLQQRSRVHAHLADAYRATGDEARAGMHALISVELDPDSTARLAAARRMATIGAPERARALARDISAGPEQDWLAIAAAELLIQLEDPHAALGMLRRTQADEDATAPAAADPSATRRDGADEPSLPASAAPSPPLHVRSANPRVLLLVASALASAGDAEEARAILAPMCADAGRPLHDKALRARFELELDHGEAAHAAEAYRALRALGFEQDPFARRRIALLLRHPSVPWVLEDVASLCGLLALLLCAALLPLLVVAPIHYRGLALRLRGAPPAEPHGPWRLRHAWAGMAALTVGSVIGAWAFAYPLLADWFSLPDVGAEPDEGQLARSYILSAVLSLMVLTPILLLDRSRDPPPGRWGVFRSLLVGCAAAFFLRFGVGLWHDAMKALAAADPLGAETTRALTGTYVHYGPLALFLLAAVAVPVSEEILFRGVLLRTFSSHVGFNLAALTQALIFAAVHEDYTLFPFFVLFALVCASLCRRSGRLLPALTAHALFNVTAAIAIAAASRWHNGTPP
jgi:uncharacterized protein